MATDALFCSLSPDRIADLVRHARRAVCYAAPGIQLDLAQAMAETAGRLGKEMLTVSLDFDDRVMRMSGEQVAQALVRLSPAAKAIAVAQAKTQKPNSKSKR